MHARRIVLVATIVLFAGTGILSAVEVSKEKTSLFGDEFHNPASWLELSGDFRFRTEYQNLYDGYQDKNRSDPERLRFPIRVRLRGKVKFSDDVDFNIGNTWQLTHWVLPKSADGSGHGTFSDGSEGVFDIFNLTVRNAFNLPLTVVIGRQDVFFGKRWLIAEGTPLDESKTGYFDAVRLTYQASSKTIFDVVYIDQKSSSDDRLKPINNDETSVVETDEQGLILNLAHRLSDRTQVSGYYIWKKDMKTSFIASGIDKGIHTFGGLYEHIINNNWDCWVESAIQTGSRNCENIEAYGLNSKLNYSFNDAHNTKISFSYEYLSGDNSHTDAYEGFDPLWGRWPQPCELLCDVYGLREGRRPAEHSNMHKLGLGWHADLNEKVDIDMNYYLLWVPECLPGSGVTTTSNKFRGQCFQAIANCKHNKFMTSQLYFELFGPGSYYADSNNDTAVFLRYQMVVKL